MRFAPSPNGYLHLGHAYSALFTAQVAHRLSGRFLLRIEDIDVTRCRKEFVDAIFEDMDWLGLSWEKPVWRQTDRFDAYRTAADRLRGMGLLYPCFCSRSDIAANSDGTDPDGAPLYRGTCKHLSQDEIAARRARGEPVQYRLKTADAIERTGLLSFTLAGSQADDRPQIRNARPGRWGDVVIQRKDVPTSYHLSVVVDDAAQEVTHVTRGRDMEAATDIHVLLQFLLGLAPPQYVFHKLILDSAGEKLSKSAKSQPLRAMRAQGWTAEGIRTHLGF